MYDHHSSSHHCHTAGPLKQLWSSLGACWAWKLQIVVSVEEQVFEACFFFEKKKPDPNNIPVYKISFENAFSIEKRLPWRNRWEKFLAFKQITITCLSNSKAFERHLCCDVWAVLWRHTAILARLAAFKMPSWLSKMQQTSHHIVL